jgi:hypothetical protein
MFILFNKVPLYVPKTLFCWCVLFSNPLATGQSKHADEYILIVPAKFVETCQTMFIIHPQVVYCLNNQSYFNRTIVFSIERKNNKWHTIGHACKAPLHKDWWHLVEAIGTAIWALTHNIVNRHSIENNSHHKNPTSWMDFPLIFTCNISSILLTDII